MPDDVAPSAPPDGAAPVGPSLAGGPLGPSQASTLLEPSLAGGPRSRWYSDLIFPVSLFAFTRAALFALAWVSLRFDPRLHRPPHQHDGAVSLDVFCRWDCGWYSGIAERGYDSPAGTNFFPLLPLLGRAVHEATGLAYPSAIVLVSNLFGLLAFIVVYRLFKELEDESTAQTALLLYAAFPFALFQTAGYAESMMVFFSAFASWCARGNRHLTAGLALGLGGLSRHLTLLAGLAVVTEHLQKRGSWRNPRFLVGLVLPVAITSLYFVYLAHTLGDPQLWWKVRSGGWSGAWSGVVQWLQHPWAPEVGLYVVASFVPGVGAFMLLTKRAWWPLASFAVPLMLTLWSVGLVGLGRYSAACWPAFLPLGAAICHRPTWKGPIIVAFALFQGMLAFLYVHSYPIN
jgi:hypothetical protein